MKTFITIVIVVALVCVGGLVYVYSGAYPVGADVPHSAPVRWLVHTVSDRSIAAHARSVQVPANVLHPDSAMLIQGAGAYASMCSICHLAPGFDRGPLHTGLYPHPPRFTHGTDVPPAEFFWETKHGVKDTGMPAWGRTHTDEELWPIVAFVEQMHDMSPEQYRAIVAQARLDKDDMPEMPMPQAAPAGKESADTTGAAHRGGK